MKKKIQPETAVKSKSTKSKSAGLKTRHQKIAESRGAAWAKAIVAGRMDAVVNPTELRIARLSKRLKQEQLAKTIGLTESSYGEIERGRRQVSKETANKISKALGQSLTHLFKQKDKDGTKFIVQKK